MGFKSCGQSISQDMQDNHFVYILGNVLNIS